MGIETTISYYLICVGAMLFCLVAFTELFPGNMLRNRIQPQPPLQKCALLALFLLVIGLCSGILASPSARDPLSIVGEFISFAIGSAASVRIITLALVVVVVVYLASKVYGEDAAALPRIASAMGILISLALLAYLTVRMATDPLLNHHQLWLLVVAFIGSAVATAYALFRISAILGIPRQPGQSGTARFFILLPGSLAVALVLQAIIQLANG